MRDGANARRGRRPGFTWRRLGWAVALLVAAVAAPLARADVADQFPDVNQVAADYPDPIERYAALSVLWDFMHAKAPESPDAKAKRHVYYEAMDAIRRGYSTSGSAAGDFNGRVMAAETPAFGHAVLERYHVLNVGSEQPAPFGPNLGGAAPGDVTDAMIKHSFLVASPFVLGGIGAMYALCFVMMRNSSNVRPGIFPPVPGSGDSPALPESLRVVHVPGLTYTVEVYSGLVIDKETTVHTTTTTSTTPSEVHVMAGQVYTTPGRTTTSTSSTRVDTVWVRTPSGREASWTFTGGQFQTRPSHLISALGRQLPDGTSSFLLAYNHTTGQFVDLHGAPHGVGGCLAWFLAFLLGAVPFGIACGIIVMMNHGLDTTDAAFLPATFLIMGAMGSVVASTLVNFWVAGRIVRRRNARFARNYVPGYRQFFAELTPGLQRLFRP